jgi:chromosome transmission fidelity protein 1
VHTSGSASWLKTSHVDKGKRCEFLPPVDEPERLEEFRDHALSQVHSIDDLEDLGREMKVCPYYGTRKAIKQAQLVTLPYNLLLQKQARDSFGINLEE